MEKKDGGSFYAFSSQSKPALLTQYSSHQDPCFNILKSIFNNKCSSFQLFKLINFKTILK